MTITHTIPVQRAAAPASNDGALPLERRPPADLPAEQAVLGGMMLSKEAAADVIEKKLTAGDFYDPRHGRVFDAIVALYGRGVPTDAITVANELGADIARLGGTFLIDLIEATPTAANAGYYANSVLEKAQLRRLIEAGTRIVQLGYTAAGGGRDVVDAVDLAQQAVLEVTESRTTNDFAVLADMLQPALDDIEAAGSRDGKMSGVPTGFTDLDRLLNGLSPGQLIIVAGRPGLGKALALDTPLPTPDGWTTMGEVRVGDRLLGADGKPTTITAAFEVMHDRPCYEVEFSDGSVIVADAEHLWATTYGEVVTTVQVARLLRRRGGVSVPPVPSLGLEPRRVMSVTACASVPVRCVTVDNDEHMYLAGRSMIPTHNSTASMDFARNAAIRANQAAAIFSLEMSKVEIVMRMLSAEARVPLHLLRSGQLSDDDWTKLARCMADISEAPLFVDDTPSMNLMEIRAKARRLKQRHDLKMIVVDYLQLMSSPKRTESRQQEVSDLSRGLKLLAKEIECPVIAVSQLNRGPEQRTDKRPQLSDLRESGSIEQDADVVILMHRDDYYDKDSARAGEADFIVAKHRNGPTDTITVAAQLHLSRFVDMAIV